jgi:cysteine desulfurase
VIYLDHSATTPVDPRVVEAMLPYFTELYGNPSSVYGLGRKAAAALEDARARVATLLDCQPAEVVFTSCGTESDNMAIRGVATAAALKGKRHLITAPVEHHAVLHTMRDLHEQLDFEVTEVPVDRSGIVDLAALENAIRPDTAIVSVMYANNEVGTIQPIAEIAALTRKAGVPFHTDAVQAGGVLSLDVDALGVDLLALSAHKFYGPKGVGLLYVRRGTRMLPTQTGGSQERGRRSGTENLPYIVALARALEIAQEVRERETTRLSALRDRLWAGIQAAVPDVELTGHPTRRMPGHLSLIVRGVEAQSLLIALDLAGIAASSGSACASGAPTPSHVLRAMGFAPNDALGALRLTLGRGTTEADIDLILERLPPIVRRVRDG